MISTKVWAVTIAALAFVIIVDLVLAILRRHKKTSLLEASLWTIFYIGAAVAFGFLLPHWSNIQGQKDFFAGWLTEYALSSSSSSWATSTSRRRSNNLFYFLASC
jgi:tellurite resistance protein TerC